MLFFYEIELDAKIAFFTDNQSIYRYRRITETVCVTVGFRGCAIKMANFVTFDPNLNRIRVMRVVGYRNKMSNNFPLFPTTVERLDAAHKRAKSVTVEAFSDDVVLMIAVTFNLICGDDFFLCSKKPFKHFRFSVIQRHQRLSNFYIVPVAEKVKGYFWASQK